MYHIHMYHTYIYLCLYNPSTPTTHLGHLKPALELGHVLVLELRSLVQIVVLLSLRTKQGKVQKLARMYSCR